jgi:signal transduction histidine kinase
MKPTRRAQRPGRTASSRAKSRSTSKSDEDRIRFLLHELQVHSEEITVQNEQLIQSQSEIEQARDRYAELYDFAPIGYLTLDSFGVIHECNFAASSILGRDRRFLTQAPLPPLVAGEYRATLRDFLRQAREDSSRDIEIRLKTVPPRFVRLISRPRAIGSGSPMLFTAMVDVTLARELEHERLEALAREQARAKQLAMEVAERRRAEERIKTLLGRIVTVQEEERSRLARDLHDQLGQQLTALRLTLSLLKEQRVADEALKQVERADGIATRLDHDVDRLAWELRPAALGEFGLRAALDALVRQWSEFHGITVNLALPPAFDARLPPEVENQLYRVAQEALNNVSKHAEATTAAVSLEHANGIVQLSVQDDGRGFDMQKVQHHPGMGLAGMRERVALVGGDMAVESSDGQGTTVLVRVPIGR